MKNVTKLFSIALFLLCLPYALKAIDAPSLVSPSNGVTEITPERILDWSYVAGNDGYLYQLDTTPNFNSNRLVEGSTVSASQITFINLSFGTIYYWRAATKSTIDTSAWSSTWSFTTTDSIQLVSPANGATNRPVEQILDWSYLNGSDGYVYELDTTPNFNSSFHTLSSTISASQITFINLRFGTTYYWRAAAKTTSDTSQWTPVWSFTTTDSIQLVSPANGATNRDVEQTLDWSYAHGNDGYVYELDTTPNFNSTFHTLASTVSASAVTFTNLRFGTTYYWRAAAKTTSDTSQWTPVWSFTTLDSIHLVSPANGATHKDVEQTLDWSYAHGNDGYVYELDTTPNFNSTFHTLASTVSASAVTFTNLRFGTTYYWRAAAKTTSDTSQWTPVWSFTTLDMPILNSPTNGAINTTINPLLDWYIASGNNGYLYRIDTTTNFNSPVLLSGNASISEKSIANLRYGTTYYWTAAIKSNVDTSSWAPPWSFTTIYQLANSPTLLSPSDGSIDIARNGQNFSWSSVAGATSYELQLSTSSTFTSGIQSIHSATTNTSLNGLSPNTTYFWRVRGQDAAGNSPWSTGWSFTTEDCETTNALNISACSSYNFNGTIINQAGTYKDTLTNSAGCDSIITLNLTLENTQSTLFINECSSYISPSGNSTWTTSGTYKDTIANSAGCDSILTIHLTIGNSSTATINETSCANYTSPSGNNWTSSGTYKDTIPNTIGCDSIITIHLVINALSSSNQTVNNCDTYTWPVNGSSYQTSGTYTSTIPNTSGCDSVITLNLTINNSTFSSENISACQDYTWSTNNTTYSTGGTYTALLTNTAGCDSIATLNLTVGNLAHTETVIECDSYLWPATGLNYTSSGTYQTTVTNSNGCDSVLTLDLTIHHSQSSIETVETCEDYTWPANGTLYTASGSYTANLNSTSGCDSIVTLNLTIHQSSSQTQTISACNSYTWSADGNTYLNSGTYNTTLSTAAGCDSLVTLHLTITEVDTSLFQFEDVLIANDSTAIYQWLDCNDSYSILPGETEHDFIAPQTGSYALEITSNGCTDTSNCYNLVSTIVNGVTAQSRKEIISVFPNPTSGHISIGLNTEVPLITTRVRDILGKVVLDKTYNNTSTINLDIMGPSGVYFLEIRTSKETLSTLKVIKN